MEHFAVRAALHLLKHMRPHAHSARGASFVAQFGERDASVFLCDARVVVEEIFGNIGDNGGALSVQRGKVFFRRSLLGIERGALSAHVFFDFLQPPLGNLHAPVIILGIHHLFEQTVFGLRNFGFGKIHFVLQCLVGLVGLYLGSLVTVFPHAILPLLHVQFVFLAVAHGSDLRCFRLIEFRARRGYASIRGCNFLREARKSRAHLIQAHIDGLQIKQALEGFLHDAAILTQAQQPLLAAPWNRMAITERL